METVDHLERHVVQNLVSFDLCLHFFLVILNLNFKRPVILGLTKLSAPKNLDSEEDDLLRQGKGGKGGNGGNGGKGGPPGGGPPGGNTCSGTKGTLLIFVEGSCFKIVFFKLIKKV